MFLLLNKKKCRFCTAESVSGGLIAATFVRFAGASQCFWGSCVSYSDDSKQELLGISSERLSQFGAVSPEIVKDMALNILSIANVDYSLALSGYAGKAGTGKEHLHDTIYWAVASKEGVSRVQKSRFYGSRNMKRIAASKRAVESLIALVAEGVVAT